MANTNSLYSDLTKCAHRHNLTVISLLAYNSSACVIQAAACFICDANRFKTNPGFLVLTRSPMLKCLVAFWCFLSRPGSTRDSPYGVDPIYWVCRSTVCTYTLTCSRDLCLGILTVSSLRSWGTFFWSLQCKQVLLMILKSFPFARRITAGSHRCRDFELSGTKFCMQLGRACRTCSSHVQTFK